MVSVETLLSYPYLKLPFTVHTYAYDKQLGAIMIHITVCEALDLNMGYYTIRIYPAIQDTTTIVTEFEKFGYNPLHVGMFSSEDIFQAKVDELLGDIEGVKTYIYDILVLSKYWSTKHK